MIDDFHTYRQILSLLGIFTDAHKLTSSDLHKGDDNQPVSV